MFFHVQEILAAFAYPKVDSGVATLEPLGNTQIFLKPSLFARHSNLNEHIFGFYDV